LKTNIILNSNLYDDNNSYKLFEKLIKKTITNFKIENNLKNNLNFKNNCNYQKSDIKSSIFKITAYEDGSSSNSNIKNNKQKDNSNKLMNTDDLKINRLSFFFPLY
jgi:hypothetical protein